MAGENILSIDCGTQSLRTILFDPEGRILQAERIVYPPYVSPKPGWAEQDPELFWQAVVDGCASLHDRSAADFLKVGGIGVTTQRDNTINLGPDGAVLRPSVIWLDTRAAHGSYRPNFFMRKIYGGLGVLEKIYKIQGAGPTNWIRENQPEIWDATWKVSQVSGFLNYRLTGRVADTPSSLVGHIPFDHKRQDWASPYSLAGKVFPIEADKLCDIVPSGETIGGLTAGAARLLGLPAGTPVIGCGSDKSCETLGMGCVDSSMASLSFGTTATVEVTSKKYFEPVRFLPAYSAAIPNTWVPEIEIFRGFWMLSWFRDELGDEERRVAEKTGCIPEEIMNRLLDLEPPGNRGLMLQPYWGASLKDIRAKGSIIGFGDVHGKGSIYRAIVEGLGYALRDGLETLEKRGGFYCETVAASGGASRSDRICGITTDILNRPLVRGETWETSALGAAVITAAGMGLYPDIMTAVKGMVRYTECFEPSGENRGIYDGLYGCYKKIYKRLKGVYKDIQDVTGYPEKWDGDDRNQGELK
ncbi:MAG: FGGY-family carbohydrate kinase [Spirochaetales bacterium]|nr:FGGY-family carbohydrate kinase [Spirochaetales bacterium]